MSLAIRASVHAPQRGASGARAPRSGSLGAIPSRKRATCHAFGMSAPLFEAIGDASTPEGSPRGDPPRLSRRAALSMSASVSLLGLGVATTARCDARPADMDPSAKEALSLARLAYAEPDAEIAVDAWDEVVRLAAAAADAGTPLPEETVSLWLAARANPLGLALFLLVCACVPLGVIAGFRGWSLDAVIERFSLNRWGLALAGCAVALWIARFAAVL